MRLSLMVALLLVACGTDPAFPEGAELTFGEASADHLAFSWPAAEGGDVAAYVVRIDGEDAARLDPHVTEYGADELAEGTEHRVEVVAIGHNGVESPALSTRATTLDGTAPRFEADEDGLVGDLAPIEVSLEPTNEEPANNLRTVHLSWPAATDAVGVTGYRVLRDGEQIGAVDATTTELTLTDVPWGEPTELAVRALDAAGNESDPGLTRRWAPPSESGREIEAGPDDARLQVERAQAQVEQLLLGALSSGDAFADVLARDAITGNAADVLANAEGVSAAPVGGGSLSDRGGGGRVGGLGGIGALRTPEAPAVRGEVRRLSLSSDAARSDLSAPLARRLGFLHHCYARGLRANPDLAGEVALHLQLEADGRVSQARVAEDTLGESSVATCLLSAHRRLRFAAGEATGLDVRYAFRRRASAAAP